MMLHQHSNVCYLVRQTPENKESWIFTNMELQENWDSTCFNGFESSLEGKEGFQKKVPKILEMKGWQIRLCIPAVTSCRLAALLGHGKYTATEDKQRKVFKYMLGIKY